ncbi:neuronal acetylcholine receptor subunit alpha-3-like [Littorina saxatilis]|uniref:Uncharacterized protein n=1 Tax=Littorina saxatilis TaxID=31220 RepID=A0AAN9GGM2_9CAEN
MSELPIYTEQRLVEDLFKNYEPSVRPYFNRSEPVHTSFGVTLVNILELNHATETLDTYLLLRQSWHDVRLQWNMTQYAGVTDIKVHPARVWKPDIVSYDNVESDMNMQDSMVVAYFTGHLIWITPLRLRTTCRVDLRNFPFDEQTCSMYFASWVYNGHEVNLTLWGGQESTAFKLKSESMNKEWEIVSHGAKVRYQMYPCCKEPFPDLVVTLTLRRHPMYYVHVFIVPALLIGLLIPFHMLLPPDSCERMTLGSILLASLLLLILKLQDALPNAHSQLPAIGLFYTLSLVWACLAMLSSILVLNLHSRGPRRGKVPDTIRWIFLRSLKRLVCLGSDTYYPINDLETISMRGLDQPKTSLTPGSVSTDRRDLQQQQQQQQTCVGDLTRSAATTTAKLEREVEEISRQLHVMGVRAHVQDARADAVNEWRLVALVVDRILFFLFLFVYLMCAVIVLA